MFSLIAYTYALVWIQKHPTTFLIVVGVLCLLISSHIRKNKKRRAAAYQQALKEQKEEEYRKARLQKIAVQSASKEVTFRVAGVTFDNDDGSSRQEILRHLRFRDEPYVDEDAELMVNFVESEYEGQLAIEVWINDYQVGHVPKSKISQVKAAMDSHAWTVDSCSIYGGSRDESGEKHSYGCEISLSWAS